MASHPRRSALIMAGGGGERFWPLSRTTRPKQFITLADRRGDMTMLDRTRQLIGGVFAEENTYCATTTALADLIHTHCPDIPPDRVIIEPLKRNTAGCLVLAAATHLAREGNSARDITLGVFPSDHYIGDTERFTAVVHAALAAAEHEDALVTLGITPNRPATGFGYLRVLPTPAFISEGLPVYTVDRFCEKPDAATAASYIAEGTYSWNSGMFFWRIGVFLDELAAAAPDLHRTALDLADAIAGSNTERTLAVFGSLPDVSIDYALMEHSAHVRLLAADFGWDDLGSWDSLATIHGADEAGNITVGDPVVLDTTNSIVFNALGADAMAVGVLGVDGLVVVVEGDAVLVAPRDRVQEVRRIVAELRRRNAPQI